MLPKLRSGVPRTATLILALTLTYAGAASATTWNAGDMVTYTQSQWGDTPDGSNIATVLDANYNTLYAPFGIFQVGSPLGFTMTFTDAPDLRAYLPAAGAAGPLDTWRIPRRARLACSAARCPR
jgi:hypothetical protein